MLVLPPLSDFISSQITDLTFCIREMLPDFYVDFMGLLARYSVVGHFLSSRRHLLVFILLVRKINTGSGNDCFFLNQMMCTFKNKLTKLCNNSYKGFMLKKIHVITARVKARATWLLDYGRAFSLPHTNSSVTPQSQVSPCLSLFLLPVNLNISVCM